MHVPVTLRQDGGACFRTKVLVDSGASINVLPLRIARKKNLLVDEERTLWVRDFRNRVEKTHGKTTLEVGIGETCKYLKFDVIRNANEPILSLAGLAELGITIECAARTLILEKWRRDRVLDDASGSRRIRRTSVVSF